MHAEHIRLELRMAVDEERSRNMDFNESHKQWLESHLRRRSGERKSRLQRGHAHAERLFLERVWWPLFGNFDHLHPEFEVMDWRGYPYFVDLVWIKGSIRIVIEIKGYGPHVQNMDRIRYRRELNRETFLLILGYRVVSIAYDDLEGNPKLIQFLLKTIFAPYLTLFTESEYSFIEREILLLTIRLGKSIRPIDVVRELHLNKRTAVKYLKRLCEKGKLRPIITGESNRVTCYEWVHSLSDDSFW